MSQYYAESIPHPIPTKYVHTPYRVYVISGCVWLCESDCSTFRSIHASYGKHGSDCGLAGPCTGTLKQGPALGQEVILHPLHQQPLTLHTVSEQRAGLQVCQELHTYEKNTHMNTQGTCDNCYQQEAETTAKCVCVMRVWASVAYNVITDCGFLRVERKLFSH